jgi:hypothetical protein
MGRKVPGLLLIECIQSMILAFSIEIVDLPWHGYHARCNCVSGWRHQSGMNIEKSVERTNRGSSFRVTVDELNDARDRLESVWKQSKFLILAEHVNMCQSKDRGFEWWIEFFGRNPCCKFARHLVR